jgi:alginate O-acetyltransferase complex protein AlgJ
MPTLRHHFANLLLPTIVFGYATYSNASLLFKKNAELEAAQVAPMSISSMLDGDVTKDLDSLYKKRLPHRNVAVGLGGNARYAVFGTGRKGVVVGSQGWLFTNEEFKEIKAADIADAVQNISEVRSRLTAMGIALLVLPLPAKADIYGEKLPKRMQSDAMAKAYEAFLVALQKSEINAVDIKSHFMAYKDAADIFLKSDTHWSPNGAELASEATKNAIDKMGLALAQGQIETMPQKPVEVWGDLTKFITLPDYAADIGLQPEKVALFRTQLQANESALDVFGTETSSPVMLVGTSYSANENWSFVDYMRQSLGVDVVNVAKAGFGPGVPMMDLLKSDTLTQTKPKIVVWEFPVRYLGSENLWKRKAEGVGDQVTARAGDDNV